jgi:hypothetical protein
MSRIEAAHLMLDTGYSMLAAGCRMLDTGFWHLVVREWLLIGNWYEVKGLGYKADGNQPL